MPQDEEGNYKISESEVQTIKERLVGLMIACPPNVQAQLGEAISVIADSDFWRRWDTLTQVPRPLLLPLTAHELTFAPQDLVSRFSATDPKINVGVLEVAHSIFNRWRPLSKTDELYIEINHVLQTFGQSFFQLLVVRICACSVNL